MTNVHNRDDLAVLLRQHDPALPQSPARLARLQAQIMQRARHYDQEPQTMLGLGAQAPSVWQRLQWAGLPVGGVATLLLGLMVGQNMPSTRTQYISTTHITAAPILAANTSALGSQEGLLFSPWQNWIREEP